MAVVDPIEHVRSKLSNYPHLRYRESANAIEVEAPCTTGFTIGFSSEPDGYTVHFEGWHEHFDTADEALSCFAMGLTGQLRLAITYRGAVATKYTLQYRDGGAWRDDSTTGLIFQPFWRRARTEIRVNPRLSAV